MKKIFSYLRGLLLIFALGLSAHAELTKLAVNTTSANVRLKPNLQAIVISSVPLGGILISEGKIGIWYKVLLPADEAGLVLKGYIHQSLVEVLGQADAPVSGEFSAATTKYRIRLVSANASICLKPDLRSPSIFTVPLGGTVLSEEKRGDWYKINSLPDNEGVVISGFVKSEDVELLEEIKPQVEPLANAEPESQAPSAESKLTKPAATAVPVPNLPAFRIVYMGGKIGLNSATINGEGIEDLDIDEPGAKSGLCLGGFITIKISKYVGFQPEILISSKGTIDTLNYETQKTRLVLTYLEFPLLTKLFLPVGEILEPNFFIGPYFSLLIGKNLFENGQSIKAEGIKSSDFGLVFGAGIDVLKRALKIGNLHFDVRYSLGLTNIYDSDKGEAKNSAINFMLGYSF